MNINYLVGIDLGTSGVKVSLFAEDMSEFYADTKQYQINSPYDGYAEQNPEDWWDSVCAALKSLNQRKPEAYRSIKAVGLSGQMHGLVLLDKNRQLLGPAIIHCDARAKAYKDFMKTEDLIRNGIISPIFSGFQLTSLLWLKNHGTSLYEKITYILSPKDYIRFRLTGELGTEWTDASATLLFDCVHRKWSDAILEKAGICSAWLQNVHSPSEVCGTVSPSAAQQTSLSKTVQVVYGGADQPMQALGNGAIKQGDLTCTIGSGGQMFLCIEEPLVHPRLKVHTFCNVMEKSWYLLGAMLTAGTAFEYFSSLLYGNYHYDLIDIEVSKNISSPSNLFFLPFLCGERSPYMGENLRGAFYGISLSHNRAHFMRAVMEGICFNMKTIYDEFNKIAGNGPEIAIASGGFIKSNLWTKMMASILDMPLLIPKNKGYQASIGAAMTAGIGTGVYHSLQEAVDTCVSFEDYIAEPDINFIGYYAEKYGQIQEAIKCNYKSMSVR